MNDDIRSIMEYYPVREMDAYVRTGLFYGDALVDICMELLYDEEVKEDTREEVEMIIDHLLAEQEAERIDWPDVTDCELLDSVFEQLTAKGIICSHHTGLDKTDFYGVSSKEYFSHKDKSSVVGYCFYTAESMFAAIIEEGLLISYGSIPVDFIHEEVVAVGQAIKAEFEAHGFQVEWDGDPMHALLVTDFLWQR